MSQQLKRKYDLQGIAPPYQKQLAILEHLFRPSPEIKQIDLCCGRGFGKTVLAIVACVHALSLHGSIRGLFLEPDVSSMNSIFLENWREIVPSDLYTINKNDRKITWINGAILFYGPRAVSGSKDSLRDKYRGRNLHFVVDDEAAVGCDEQQYTNTLGAIRGKGLIRFYFTSSTPKVGAYKRLIEGKAHKLYRGSSEDNPYLPDDYVPNLIVNMSAEQVRREVYGEFVSLEGRIWKGCDLTKAWPNGNINHQWTTFKKDEPWWLLIDIGSASGAFAVIQQTTGHYNGRKLFGGPHWVAVAELCPDMDASASRAFQLLDDNFGPPMGISGGADLSTRSSTDGSTVSYFAQQIWGNVRIYPCNESIYNKQVQYDKLSFLMCCVHNFRRFSIARDYIVLDTESKRGIKEMVDEDVWPDKDKRLPTEYFPKGREVHVQHIRDALLMGSATIMAPPKWTKSQNRAK